MAETSLNQLAERARTDEDFRRRAREDLEGTLAAEGIDLDEDQLAAVRQIQSQTADMSDEDIVRALSEDTWAQG